MNGGRAVLNDYNSDLMLTYKVVKEDFNALKDYLEKNVIGNHSEAFYYTIRAWDRDKSYNNRSDVEKAARFLYLNKTCFNGIYRVNKNNQFNVPYGKYSSVPKILDEKNANNINEYLTSNNILFMNGDYTGIDKKVKKGDLVYFDPPYDISKNGSVFVAYTQNGFRRKEQLELKLFCDKLIKRGATVFISNSNTDFINKLYFEDNENQYYEKVEVFKIHRTIGSVKKSRRLYSEVLIKGKLNI